MRPQTPPASNPAREPIRSRWAAIGAALAVTVGGLLTASADTPSAQADFVSIAPCRVVDTRPGSDNVGTRATPLGNGETYSTAFVGAVGRCNIPSNAIAVVLNLAIVNPTGNSYLTVFPTGGALPLAANLNFVAGQAPVSNAATVRIGDAGKLSFYNLRGTVDVTADVSGYYLLPAQTPTPSTTQHLVIPGEALAFDQNRRADVGGCVGTSDSTTLADGEVPIVVPIGATITSFGVVYEVGAHLTSAKFILRRTSMTSSTAMGLTELATLAATADTGSTYKSVTAPGFTPVTVNAADRYYVWVHLDGSFASALCSVHLDITLP